MKIVTAIGPRARHITVSIHGRGLSFTLRRFPWPVTAVGRRCHAAGAREYADNVAKVLGVQVETDAAIECGVLIADAGLVNPNHHERRLRGRRKDDSSSDDNNPDV